LSRKGWRNIPAIGMEGRLGTRKRTDGAGGATGDLAGRSSGPFDVLSKAHLTPGGARRIVEVGERKPRRGLFPFIEQPEVILPDRDFHIDIIVLRAPRGSRGRPLRPAPELEVTQDSLNDAGGVDEAHDLQRTGTTATERRLGFIHFLDQSRPSALARPGASVLSIGGGRQPGRRGSASSCAGAADMGPLAVVPNELLAGIGNMDG